MDCIHSFFFFPKNNELSKHRISGKMIFYMHDEETVFSKDLFYMSKCIFGNSEDFFFNSSNT